MTQDHFLYGVQDHVARITIQRPTAFNALNLASMRQFLDIVTGASSDAQVRVVVLTGAGDKAFCAGGDVAEFAQDPSTVGRLVGEMTTALHTAISRLAWMDAPVIAAVNGVAAGAGLALVAACDLAIAAEHASFTSAYTQIGLSPDGSSTYFLPRLIGRRRAMEMFLTHRKLSAAQALDWGLVNQVVPAADLQTTVDRLAAQLAQGPKAAHGGVKRLMMMTLQESLESQMAHEARQVAAAAQSADGVEGVRAFVARRGPQFNTARFGKP